jgi:type III secretion protein W
MVEKIPGASPVDPLKVHQMQQAAKAAAMQQTESEEDLQQWTDSVAFNPVAMSRRFRTLQEVKGREQELEEQERAQEEEQVEEQVVNKVEQVDTIAMRYQRTNNELRARTLVILRSRISARDTPEEVIAKVLAAYPDVALADEAFDFLLETSDGSTADVIRTAQEQFRARYEREIKAGRNMGMAAREFSKEGLGSPTALRDLYRDITANPREPIKLFDELSNRYPYHKLRTAIHFLLHSLGADLRAKGPSISRPELKLLIDDVRSLQSVLGVYRFFKERMSQMTRQFSLLGLSVPARLTFEALAKQLIRLLAERFLSPDKILLIAKELGVSEQWAAQEIVYVQMLDATKQISPQFYRNLKHREELKDAFLKVLDDLEEKIEKEEEEREAKKKKKK